METAVRPVLDQLKFQVALVKTDLLFEACDRLAEPDRRALYEEIKERLLKRIEAAETPRHELATSELQSAAHLLAGILARANHYATEQNLTLCATSH
jgi:hypothetical protein